MKKTIRYSVAVAAILGVAILSASPSFAEGGSFSANRVIEQGLTIAGSSGGVRPALPNQFPTAGKLVRDLPVILTPPKTAAPALPKPVVTNQLPKVVPGTADSVKQSLTIAGPNTGAGTPVTKTPVLSPPKVSDAPKPTTPTVSGPDPRNQLGLKQRQYETLKTELSQAQRKGDLIRSDLMATERQLGGLSKELQSTNLTPAQSQKLQAEYAQRQAEFEKLKASNLANRDQQARLSSELQGNVNQQAALREQISPGSSRDYPAATQTNNTAGASATNSRPVRYPRIPGSARHRQLRGGSSGTVSQTDSQ